MGKNQRNRSSNNNNNNNNNNQQINGHVDATSNKESGDSIIKNNKSTDNLEKTSENIENNNQNNNTSNNNTTGLYKNERLAQCLTSCIGAETRLTVVNGAEYTGFFHTFSKNSELVV